MPGELEEIDIGTDLVTSLAIEAACEDAELNVRVLHGWEETAPIVPPGGSHRLLHRAEDRDVVRSIVDRYDELD